MVRLSVVTLVFITAISALAQAASLGDPFDGNDLKNPNWLWTIEPLAWDVGQTTPGWLHIQGEGNRNLWASDTTNRLYQEHNDDFDVATHLIMDYEPASTVAGVVAYSPTTKDHNNRDGEWVTLKLWGRGGGDNNAVIQYQKREFDGGEGLVGTVAGYLEPAGPTDLFMRLRREGETFTAWYKRAAADDWIQVGQTQHQFAPDVQVGIYAGIADAAGQMTTQFEYFEDMSAPFAVAPRAKLPVAWADLKLRQE